MKTLLAIATAIALTISAQALTLTVELPDDVGTEAVHTYAVSHGYARLKGPKENEQDFVARMLGEQVRSAWVQKQVAVATASVKATAEAAFIKIAPLESAEVLSP